MTHDAESNGAAHLRGPFGLPGGRVNRVYLSGPMTGYPELNFPAFFAWADTLRGFGFEVLNPADHGLLERAQWGDYLRCDIADLITCQGIALLPGWSKSRGARLELYIAQSLDMTVRLLGDAEPVLTTTGEPR